MQEQKELKKETFVKLSELQKDDIVSGLKKKEFVKVPATLVRSFAKRTGREIATITLKLHDPQFTQLSLQPGNQYLSTSLFHKILVATDSVYNDPKGQPIVKWNKETLVRFVKGTYTNRDDEYYSLEVIFKQGIYITHFFSYDDVQTLNLLEEKGLYKPNWITRPDKIEFVETEKFEF